MTVRILIYLFILTTFVSCGDTTEKQKAKEFFDKGLFTEAIAEYDQAFIKAPTDCELFVGRADCNRKLSNFNKVIPDLEDALRLGCVDGRIYNNLGDAYFKTGKFDSAINYLQKALAANFQQGTVSANLGICYSTLGQKELAEKFLKQAITLDPDTADNYYFLGTHLQQYDSLDEALLNLNKAIELKADFPTFYIKRASIFWGLGDHAKAISDADKALSLNPDKSEIEDALYIKVYCYFNLNRMDDACKALIKLKEIDPTKDYADIKLDCDI